MLNKIAKLLSIFVLLLLIFSNSAYAETYGSRAIEAEGLVWYMDQYGIRLKENVIHRMKNFSPVQINCNIAEVQLTEVLYDGCWMYTAATIQPVNPEDTLLMPGSAGINEKVCGGYEESRRKDTRTFEEAAREDHKKIYAVYVYPQEFDFCSFYFLDHRQDDNEQSTLFSGAPLFNEDLFKCINLSTQIYEVNLLNSNYTLVEDQIVPVPVYTIGEICIDTYQCKNDIVKPFDELVLIRTPVATYANAIWKSLDDYNYFQFDFLDASGNSLPNGAPADPYAYIMNTVPSSINVKITNKDGDVQILKFEKTV